MKKRRYTKTPKQPFMVRLTEETRRALDARSKQEKLPPATLAREMIEKALALPSKGKTMKKLQVRCVGVGPCMAYAHNNGRMSYNSIDEDVRFVPETDEDKENYKDTMKYGESIPVVIKLFEVTSNDVSLGHYYAESAYGALDALARDAGYADYADALARGIAPFQSKVQEVEDQLPWLQSLQEPSSTRQAAVRERCKQAGIIVLDGSGESQVFQVGEDEIFFRRNEDKPGFYVAHASGGEPYSPYENTNEYVEFATLAHAQEFLNGLLNK